MATSNVTYHSLTKSSTTLPLMRHAIFYSGDRLVAEQGPCEKAADWLRFAYGSLADGLAPSACMITLPTKQMPKPFDSS